MNRSFRALDSKMPESLHQRAGTKLGSSMKEKEEELALFLEMRKREKERHNLLLHNADEFDPSLGSNPDSSPVFKITTSTAPRKVGSDDFLNSDGDKNDYNWLLTPPGTPLFPSLEKEPHGPLIGQLGTPKVRPAALKSRLSGSQTESAPRSNPMSRQPISALSTSNAGLHRHSLSSSTSSTASRSSTPTGRSTLATAAKATRPSTPTARPTLPSTKPISSSARPSTPSARSSTPTARPILPSKPSSRPSTPTRGPSTPSTVSNNAGPPGRSLPIINNPGPPGRSSIMTSNSGLSGRSSPMTNSSGPACRSFSVTKSRSTTTKNPVPPRGASPTVRYRPWQPSEMPGFSLDAPPNLRTSVPERPVSASRGRPGAPSSLKSGAAEVNSNGRPRRQSCSPLRGRTPNTSSQNNGALIPTSGRLQPNAGDSVSPVVIGSKMVERVINVRRLAPPRQDDLRCLQSNPLGKSSPDSAGFGRTLSKKSLDMALRHMDIRGSIPGSLGPLVTNIPASSLYSVRSGPARSRPVSISDSPLATSSNASSEQSVNNNLCLDISEMDDDDRGSEKGGRLSPAGQPGSALGSTNWLHIPEIREKHD